MADGVGPEPPASIYRALVLGLRDYVGKNGFDGVVLGGVIEDSAKAQASIFVVFPLMLFLMATILMIQLKSFQRLFLVTLTAPLALIGVALTIPYA